MTDPTEAQQLNEILAEAPWAVFAFRLSTDGKMTVPYASAGIGRVFGVSPAALRGDASLLFGGMPAADAAACQASISESARKLTPWREEFRFMRPDGAVVWIEGSSIPRREPDGSVIWKGVCQDVTDRHRIEGELRATQDLLQLLITQAPVSIAMLDRELRYVAASQRWIDAFAPTAGDIVGRCHYDVLPDVPEKWRAANRAGLAGQATSGEDDPWARPDGGQAWYRWAVHPWRAADGEIAGIIVFVDDVTARKRDEERLRASEQRYRELVNLAPDAIFLQRGGKILLANPAALALFGVSVMEELVGRSVWDVLHPDDHPRVRARLAEIAKGLPQPRHAMRVVRLNGDIRDVEAAATPFADVDGDAVQVMMRDVTDQRRAEAALRDGEQRFGAVFDSAMDGIITIDESHHIVLANPAAERIFGYVPGGLLGRGLDTLIPVRLGAGHADHVRAFGRDGVTQRAMGRLGMVAGVRANGEEFPIEASISHIQVGGKKLFTVIHRDISERVRAEHALEEERQRFRQLAESIREVFWLTDVAKQSIVYVSPAYETIWGRSCAKLYEDARNWMDAIHPDDRERVTAAAMTKQRLGTYDEQYRITRPDGSVRWIHDRAFPVRDAQGAVIRVAGVAEDVTERRLLEEQFRQTQKMESVGRLAGGVAHDFNNLLTVIVSSAELLREQVEVSPDQRALVHDIVDAGRRGASLTRQLLSFTRQEVVEPRVMDLSDVVADADKLLRRLIGEDVTLVTHLDSATTPVRIDPGQWSQVLLNLAVNARDAMSTGGTLEIGARSVVLDADFERRHPGVAAGRYAALTVRDTGAGMSEAVRQRIFEPFFTTKARSKGTGLGLAVVYGVVHQAGGHIEVESAPGVGTTFTIYLPSAGPPLAAAAAASLPPAAPATGNESVLVVEDEAPVRRVAVRILSAKGYRVLSAADGIEALELLAAEHGAVDLLLTDMVMPNLDGAALAVRVRERYPHAKVLYASGYIDESVSGRGIAGDESSFLQKPYSPAMLLQRVREVLDA